MVGDVVDDVVADLGDVLLAAGHLPDPGPEPLLLELVAGARQVVVLRHVGQPVQVGALLAQEVGDAMRVLVEKVLPALARSAGQLAGGEPAFVDAGHETTVSRATAP